MAGEEAHTGVRYTFALFVVVSRGTAFFVKKRRFYGEQGEKKGGFPASRLFFGSICRLGSARCTKKGGGGVRRHKKRGAEGKKRDSWGREGAWGREGGSGGEKMKKAAEKVGEGEKKEGRREEMARKQR
ncbi:MAG: hypothetical protein J6V07_02355 [Clostridia bacterium]|nr:hypothetical protein [Clostridia bacterium]